MQVGHRLAAVGAGVDDHPVPMREALLPGDRTGRGQQLDGQARVGVHQRGQVPVVLAGHDQHVRRGLRGDVAKGERAAGHVYDLRGHLTGDDAAEQAAAVAGHLRDRVSHRPVPPATASSAAVPSSPSSSVASGSAAVDVAAALVGGSTGAAACTTGGGDVGVGGRLAAARGERVADPLVRGRVLADGDALVRRGALADGVADRRTEAGADAEGAEVAEAAGRAGLCEGGDGDGVEAWAIPGTHTTASTTSRPQAARRGRDEVTARA